MKKIQHSFEEQKDKYYQRSITYLKYKYYANCCLLQV